MRTTTSLLLGVSTVLGAVTFFSACGSTESTCQERGDCANPCGDPSYAVAHPDLCPDAGTGGTGGTAGSGGTGGVGGVGGDSDAAGDAGSGGEGGVAGQDAGDAGDAADVEAGGSGGDDAGDAEAEAYCDPASMPEDDPCVIHEDHGVFVSPTGSDDASCGTRSGPCQTLTRGMTNAKAAGKRVYACGDGGAYVESLTIGASLDGLLVLGGFQCSDWSYEPTSVRAAVEPATGPALVVEGLTEGVDFRSFAFRSADATGSGESSVAGIVRSSSGVVFRGCSFEAGAGAAGVDGTSGGAGESVPLVGAEQQGDNSTCGTSAANSGGAWLTPFVCAAGGTTLGGAGGTALYSNKDGLPGDRGTPITDITALDLGDGGPGGTSTDKGGKNGELGSDGNAGENGTAAVAGVLSEAGYTPADGGNGTNGRPAQGGGGGGASWSITGCVGPSGGAGGLGGCGGFAGTKGTGGGASIALLAWSSTVTLEDCSLTSAGGGKGGDGGDGGGGSLGANGHIGGGAIHAGMVGAGAGAPGGNGGPGGSGSGGTGGPSHAIVFHGSEPVQQGAMTLTPGTGGPKGVGGQASGGLKAPDGLEGASAGVFEVP